MKARTKGFLIALAVVAVVGGVASEAMKDAGQRADEDAARAAALARLRAARAAEATLKQSLREPESLKWTTLRASPNGSLVCGEYRARNGFGGMTSGLLVVVDGKASPEPAAWNKHCLQRLPDVLASL